MDPRHQNCSIVWGHYGDVCKCVHCATQQTFAVKSVDKSKTPCLDCLQREVYLLRKMDHYEIARMVSCYKDTMRVYMIIEKCAGNKLFDTIIKNTRPDG